MTNSTRIETLLQGIVRWQRTAAKLLSSLLLAVSLIPGISAAETETSPKVFMYVTDGARDLELMLREEVGVMQQMLEDAGYEVDIATSAGQKMATEELTLTPTILLADVNIDDYAGVILPCMAPAPGTSNPPPAVNEILRQALDTGKPIAAARGSVATLAAAGGIAGRKYAYAGAVDIAKRPTFAGGKFLGTGVIRDGAINTSGICPLAARSLNEPDGTVELTQNFIASLAEAS